jgi:hypothetical protein
MLDRLTSSLTGGRAIPGKLNSDLFGIVDLVALAGLFNSFRVMRLPEPPASGTLRETTLG